MNVATASRWPLLLSSCPSRCGIHGERVRLQPESWGMMAHLQRIDYA